MKKLGIVYLVSLYAAQAPFLIASILPFSQKSTITSYNPYFLTGFILEGISIILGLVYGIVLLANVLTPELRDYRFAMILKFALIPYFVINFYLSTLTVGGLLNPWLAWSAFLVVPLLVSLTYAVMLISSISNVVALIRDIIQKKRTFRDSLMILIFHFFFVFDDLGAILLFIQERKKYATPPSLKPLKGNVETFSSTFTRSFLEFLSLGFYDDVSLEQGIKIWH